MKENKIPLWIFIYIAVVSAISCMIGLIEYINPTLMFGTVLKGADPLNFGVMARTLASRNIGVALAVIFVIVKKDAKYLLLLYIIRFLIELQDFFAMGPSMAPGIGPLIGMGAAWLVIFWLPELFAIKKLWKIVSATE